MTAAPIISCQCVTYGRVSLLQEALASFLSQDFEESEMVIFNDFPQQTLVFDHPRVRIINLAMRGPSMGWARNACTEQCRGHLIVRWDDDDLQLPHHLSQLVSNWRDGESWVGIVPHYYAEGWAIKSVAGGRHPNSVAFTKDAWRKIGGFMEGPLVPNMHEDQVFMGKLYPMPGHEVESHRPSFIYHWGNGAYHVTGSADTPTSHQRVGQHVESEVRRQVQPTGIIKLEPQFRKKPVDMVTEFCELRTP